MSRVDMLEWLDATVVDEQQQGPRSPPSPFDDVTEISSGLQTLALAQAEPGSVVLIEEIAPAEEDDVVDASDDDELELLDPAEFEGIESLAVSIRERPLARRLRVLFMSVPYASAIRERIADSRLPRLFAPIGGALRALWPALKPSIARALASVPHLAAFRERIARSRLPHLFASARDAIGALLHSKMPRVYAIAGSAVGTLRSAVVPAKTSTSADDPDAIPLLAERHSRQRIATIAVWAAVALGAWALGSRLVALFDF